MYILVTGGLGFLGSNIVCKLLQQGHKPIVVDNLENSYASVINDITRITNKTFRFYFGDIRDIKTMDSVFIQNNIDAVIHLAGLKSVKNSNQYASAYYSTNVGGTALLLDLMTTYKVKNIIFSSSATVYGNPRSLPFNEDHPLLPINVYGETKLAAEKMIIDIAKTNGISAFILRYFNPIGANEHGLLGDNPRLKSENLMPAILDALLNDKPLSVFGNTYPTADGTAIRDYIHVVDLAEAHCLCLNKFIENKAQIINVGSGTGFSVLNMIETFKHENHVNLNYEIKEQRDGDIAISYADTHRSYEVLSWKPQYTLQDMCKSSYQSFKKP